MTMLARQFRVNLPPNDALVACAKAVASLGWKIESIDPKRIVSTADMGSTRNPSTIEVVLNDMGQRATLVRVNGTRRGSGFQQKLTGEINELMDAIRVHSAEGDAPGAGRRWSALSRPRRGLVLGGIALALIAAVAVGVLEARWKPDRRYEDAVRESSPVAWWRFDDLQGTVARDSAPPAQNGRYVGQVGRGVEGPLTNRIDTAVSFDGFSSVILGDRFDFAGRAPFSVEAWVKPRLPQPSPFTRIVSKESFSPGGKRNGWALYFDDSARIVGFERRNLRRAQSAVSQTRLPDDEYTYLGGTFDGSTARLYIDGREVGNSGSSRPVRMRGNTNPLTIGRLWRPRTAFLAGTLDEVSIYDRALSATEVEDHWTAAR